MGERCEDEPDVCQRAPAANMGNVAAGPLVEAVDTATLQLSEVGEPRDCIEATAPPAATPLETRRRCRAGADQAHAAGKNVEKLRHLVEMGTCAAPRRCR